MNESSNFTTRFSSGGQQHELSISENPTLSHHQAIKTVSIDGKTYTIFSTKNTTDTAIYKIFAEALEKKATVSSDTITASIKEAAMHQEKLAENIHVFSAPPEHVTKILVAIDSNNIKDFFKILAEMDQKEVSFIKLEILQFIQKNKVE